MLRRIALALALAMPAAAQDFAVITVDGTLVPGTIPFVNRPIASNAWLTAVGASGDLIGRYQTAYGASQGFVVHEGALSDVRPPPEFPVNQFQSIYPMAVNRWGQVVATVNNLGSQSFVRDPSGAVTAVSGQASATSINDLGQVTGYTTSGFPRHPFIWSPGAGLTSIALPAGWNDSQGQGINNLGHIAGNARGSPTCANNICGIAPSIAFYWSPESGMVRLPDLGGFASCGFGGCNFSAGTAFAINDSDTVVGAVVDTSGHSFAAVWRGGALTTLCANGQATSIDAAGDIVGFCGSTPTYWPGDTLQPVSLSPFGVSGNPAVPAAIAGAGLIVTQGFLPRPLLAPAGMPVAAPGVYPSVHGGATLTLDGSGSSAPDAAPTDLLYQWKLTGAPDGSAAVLSPGDGGAHPQVTLDVTGTYLVSLAVTDPATGLRSLWRTATIADVNNPPVAVAPDVTTVPGRLVILNASASSDPDGDPITFSWTAFDPDGQPVALNGADQAVASFPAGAAGVYEVQVTVTDPFGASAAANPEVRIISDAYVAGQLSALRDTLLARYDQLASSFRTPGLENAYLNLLKAALGDLERSNGPAALQKLNEAVNRGDGCGDRGAPDGSGPGMDWVVSCGLQQFLRQSLEPVIAEVSLL